tara:strand:- start:5517 stop:6236 length:720 start_codon:yes stop_codon:yes gene_type:complete
MSVENIVFDKNRDDIFHQDMMDYKFIQGVFGREDTSYVPGKPMKHHRVPGESWDTKYGITYKAYNKKYSENLNTKVKNLTEDQAIQHYIDNDLAKAKYIYGGPDGSQDLTYKMTDIGINAGPQVALEIMQKSINNVLDRYGYDNEKLKEDGKWGKKTDKYYKQILANHGKEAEAMLMDEIIAHQHLYYRGEKFNTKQISKQKVDRYYWNKAVPGKELPKGGWVTRANWNPLDKPIKVDE